MEWNQCKLFVRKGLRTKICARARFLYASEAITAMGFNSHLHYAIRRGRASLLRGPVDHGQAEPVAGPSTCPGQSGMIAPAVLIGGVAYRLAEGGE